MRHLLQVAVPVLCSALLYTFVPSQSYSQTKRQNRSEPATQIKPEWRLVCKDKDETSAYYIKTNRIGRTKEKTILVWEKQAFLAREDKGEYLILLFEHDCAEGKSRNLEFSRYSKDGGMLHHSSRANLEELDMMKWTYVAPGSVREAILNAACTGTFNEK